MSIVYFPEDPSLPSIFQDSSSPANDDPWSLNLSQLAEEDSEDAETNVDPWDLSSPDSQALFAPLIQLTQVENGKPRFPDERIKVPIENAPVLIAQTPVHIPVEVGQTGLVVPSHNLSHSASSPVNASPASRLSIDSLGISAEIRPRESYLDSARCLEPESRPCSPFMASEAAHTCVPTSPNDCILITDSPSKAEKHFERRDFSHGFSRLSECHSDCTLEGTLESQKNFAFPKVDAGPQPVVVELALGAQSVGESRHDEAWKNEIDLLNGQFLQAQPHVRLLGTSIPVETRLPTKNANSLVPLPLEQDAELMQSFCSVGWLKRKENGERQTIATSMADIYPNAAVVRKKVRKTGSLLSRSVGSRGLAAQLPNVLNNSSHVSSPTAYLNQGKPELLQRNDKGSVLSDSLPYNAPIGYGSRAELTSQLTTASPASCSFPSSSSSQLTSKPAVASSANCSFSSSSRSELTSRSTTASPANYSFSSSSRLELTQPVNYSFSSSSCSAYCSGTRSSSCSGFSRTGVTGQTSHSSCHSNYVSARQPPRTPLVPLTFRPNVQQHQFHAGGLSVPRSHNNLLGTHANFRPTNFQTEPNLRAPRPLPRYGSSPNQAALAGASLTKPTSSQRSALNQEFSETSEAPPPAFEGFRSGQGKPLSVSDKNMQRAMRLLADIDGAPL